MGQPFVGQLAFVGFNFAPAGWMICNGALLSIAEQSTLFNLIGTTYGGDGQNTFAIPNLCGRTPVHQGAGYFMGQTGGTESVTLTSNQMPAHNHPVLAGPSNGNSNLVAGGILSAAGNVQAYTSQGSPDAPLNRASVSSVGGSQPHDNLQPYLTCNWVISLYGVYPSPS